MAAASSKAIFAGQERAASLACYSAVFSEKLTAPVRKTKVEVPETPVEASDRPVHKHHGGGAAAAVAPAKSPKAANPAKAERAEAAAAAAAKKKYVPPPVAEAPRKAREPLSGIKLPKKGERNVLITSALPYVNNVPHLGNIIGCVLSADVYARYLRQRGTNCVYICGTDEYGTATETKAAEEGLTPRQVCDKYFAIHSEIYKWFDIAFDHFGRTSCEDPWKNPEWPQTKIAQEIFLDNHAAGTLQAQSVDQVFCLGCSKFLADRFIEGECPLCHYEDARGDQCDKCGKLLNATELLSPRCKTDKAHAVEVRTSNHMFLDLPKLEPKLREWITKSSTEGKWTANSVAITDGWLASGLKPRCITRDLKWGTPVPLEDYKSKVFYVWFDAPIGYVSITANYTDQWRQWWCNEEDPEVRKSIELVQFMGKDNIPFHTVIFPASLMGTGKPWTLLHHVSTTEWLNYEGGKFSKSRGTGVFGDGAMSTGIPSEVWRYYLLASRPETSDSSFSWTDFAEKNNGELLKCLGNLVQRGLSFVADKFGGVIPGVVPSAVTERDHAFVAEVNGLLKDGYIAALDAVKLKAGLKGLMDIAMAANKYMQDCEPWAIKATNPPRCATVISIVASAVRLLAALAEPFMPGFTDKVCHILDLPHADIPDAFDPLTPTAALAPAEPAAAGGAGASSSSSSASAPSSGGVIVPAGHRINKPTPLFSAITPDQVEALRARFGGVQEVTSPASSTGGGAAAAPAAAASGAGATAAAAKGKGGGGKGGAKAAAPAAGADASADLSDIARVDLRVGRIVKAWPHPTLDKLWCEEILCGDADGKPRTVASGLRAHYPSADQLIGRDVVVVCNLKPRVMGGFESRGMVLCAASADDSKVEFVDPPAGSQPGERIQIPGHVSTAANAYPAEEINANKKNNPWSTVAPELKTNDSRVAVFKGAALCTSAGECKAPTLAGCVVR